MSLTQDEANQYLVMVKYFEERKPIKLGLPTCVVHELIGEDRRSRFRLETWFHKAVTSRYVYVNSVHASIELVRLCAGDRRRHPNPDGTIIRGNHLHVYREGFGTRWAIPLSDCGFSDIVDFGTVLREFCRYCNIADVPELQLGML